MNNIREITYYDVSPFAALSARASPSNNLQIFSDVQSLFVEGMDYRSIQTCEHNYTVLDGTHNAFAANENIALWSSQQSAFPSRQLPTPVTLDITFGGLQSSPGIAFYFDTSNNVYADIVSVQWYRDGALLSDATFYPDSAVYSYVNEVEFYDRVYITMSRLNMPYRFLRLEAVFLGIIRIFGDSELESLTINEGCDPTNQSIYINSMNFSINTKNAVHYMFRNRQPLVVKYKGIEYGRYYLDKAPRKTPGRFNVEAIDKIGILDQTDDFWGGMYSNMPAATLINNIVNGLFPVVIDSSLQAVPINGWIPITSKRDALALVAMAIGAIVDATRTDEIRIRPIPTQILEIIPEERVYRTSVVNIEFPYTGIELIEHNYVQFGTQKDLFKDTFSGVVTVRFQEPMWQLFLEQGSVGTIAYAHANYAILLSDGSGETHLLGYSYIDNQNSVIIRTPYTIQGTQERMMKIDKGYLINRSISQAVTQRLFNYYQRQEVFDGEFVTKLPEAEQIGDVVQIATVFDDDLVGQIEKLTLNLGYKNIKARGVIRGD